MNKTSSASGASFHDHGLARLIALAQAAQHGYAKAAEETSSSYLKNLFQKYELQRSQFALELQQLLFQHNQNLKSQNLEHEQTITQSLEAQHLHWTSPRDLFEELNDQVVLEETLLNETASLRSYENVLEQTLLANEKALIEKQFSDVKSAIWVLKNQKQKAIPKT